MIDDDRAPTSRSHLRVVWSINLVVPEDLLGPGFEPVTSFGTEDDVVPSARLDDDGSLRVIELPARYARLADGAVAEAHNRLERVEGGGRTR